MTAWVSRRRFATCRASDWMRDMRRLNGLISMSLEAFSEYGTMPRFAFVGPHAPQWLSVATPLFCRHRYRAFFD